MTDDKAAAERPDEVPEPTDQQFDPNSVSMEDLAELIRSEGVVQEAPKAEPEEPEPEAENEPVAEPEAKEDEAKPEPDPLQLRDAQMRLEREQWQARYERLEQHAGRLAGEIGHLKKQISSGGYQESAAEPDGSAISELSRRLEDFERRSNAEAAARAIHEEITSVGQRPELASLNLQEEIQQAAAKYSDKWQEILKIEDPSQARLAARELASGVVMDAIGLRIQKKPAEPARNEARVVDRKLAVSATGATGARVGVRPKPIDPNTIPLNELKKMIDKLSGAE